MIQSPRLNRPEGILSKVKLFILNSVSETLSVGLELRDVSCKYLYSTDTEINLMDDKTFEELTIPKSIVKPEIYNLLEDGLSLKMRFAQDKPVGLVLPRIIKCTVAEVLDSAEGTDKKYQSSIWI